MEGISFSDSKTMDLLLDAVCVVDAEGRYVYVNAAFESIFGYSPIEVIGRPMIELVHPDDRERTLQTAGSIMAGKAHPHFENRYVRKDGRVVHIMWSARWSEIDRVRIAVARDVSWRKRADVLQAAVHDISEATHAAVNLPNLCGHLRDIVETLLPVDMLHLVFPAPINGETHMSVCRPGVMALAGESLAAEVAISRRPMRTESVVSESVSSLGVPLSGPDGLTGALVILASDAAYGEDDVMLLEQLAPHVAAALERKRLLVRLEHSAFYDPLTDLPNRRLFQDRLQDALTLARREDARLAVLYLDLDLFKEVNDRHGHEVGDLLLTEVAARLRNAVRESDTVARVGGDEFVVLLRNVPSVEAALKVAEHVRRALECVFSLNGQELHVLPSIGIAMYPEHGVDYRHLMHHADAAMYQAKQNGGNRVCIWRE